MINIETLDYETKIYTLICGLLSLDVSEPMFLEKVDDYSLILNGKKQNIAAIKSKLIKRLYQSCKTTQHKKNIVEIVDYLREVTQPQVSLELQDLLNSKNGYYPNEIRTSIIKNYIRRFNFFYLQYFDNIYLQKTTQKEINTLAMWALFFLLT